MNLIESILTKNECYIIGAKITVKGLMLHSVGCPQPSAKAFVNSWNTFRPNGVQVCVHAFVDPNETRQTLPWNWRGWHGGGSSNNTHIGVEMTEPSTIRYTSGSNWTDLDPATTKAHVMATYKNAVELFAYLCKQFILDPLKDGVIISHKEGCARGIASNHGDPEHMWNKYGLTMNQFRKDVKAAIDGQPSTPSVTTGTAIMGTAKASAEQLAAYLISRNTDIKGYALDYAKLFIGEGKAEGVRGDIAFAQSCLETGNFTFRGDVKAGQNNFAGIGATGGGVPGNTFNTPQEGIRVQIQHLKAYACSDALNQACIDPRFKYVTRGSAQYVEWLGIPDNPNGKGWAAGADYGKKILTILSGIIGTEAGKPQPETPTAGKYNVGDIVTFNGGPVYKSSTAVSTPTTGAASKCKVTVVANGAAHPYHCISEDGKGVYGWVDAANVGTASATFKPYTVRVEIGDLNIRTGPGTDHAAVGKFTGKGVFTIVEEATGKGATKWGLLKSYQGKRNGWVSLDFATKC